LLIVGLATTSGYDFRSNLVEPTVNGE